MTGGNPNLGVNIDLSSNNSGHGLKITPGLNGYALQAHNSNTAGLTNTVDLRSAYAYATGQQMLRLKSTVTNLAVTSKAIGIYNEDTEVVSIDFDGQASFASLTEHAGGVKVTNGRIDLENTSTAPKVSLTSTRNSEALRISGLKATEKNSDGESVGLNIVNEFSEIPADSDYLGINSVVVGSSTDTTADICLYNARGSVGSTPTAAAAVIGYNCDNLHNDNVNGSIVGYRAASTVNSGSSNAGDRYGFLSELTTAGVGNKYNFYAAGAAPNYFAGQLFCSPNSLNVNFWNQLDRGFIKTYAGNNAIVSTGDKSHAPIQVSVGADFSTTKFLFSAQSGAGNGGSIVTASGGDLAFNNTSDYRVKTNVQNYSGNASDKISALRLVSYTRTDFNVDVPIGFIAHELQEQIPEAVFGDKDKEVAIGTLADYDGTELETSVVEPEELEYTEEVEATPYVAAVEATYDEDGNELTAYVPEVEATYTTVTRTKTWTSTGTKPVYQGIDQTKLIPLLTKALQEALERIEALEAQLNP